MQRKKKKKPWSLKCKFLPVGNTGTDMLFMIITHGLAVNQALETSMIWEPRYQDESSSKSDVSRVLGR